MKIATFNINGIKARIQALTDWLNEAQPDVALLQEIKSVDENFPRAHFEGMGYQVETHGQKSFNGVAILSKLPLEDVTRGLPEMTVMNRPAGSKPQLSANGPFECVDYICRMEILRLALSMTTSSTGCGV